MKLNIGKTIGGGRPVTLDLMRLVDSRALITASSGGGKSWALRLLAEQSCRKIQTIILDPEGEFASLREKFDFLLVAKGGEIQPEVRAAGLLAKKLAELQVGAIIDLFDLQFDQRRLFVKQFLDSLLNVPRALWHPMLVMLDEAHKFCPEGGDVDSSDAVIDLMSQGRKRGICGILATQRLSKLSKDAAAEANNNLIGRTPLGNDQKRAAEILGLAKSDWPLLRDLPDGGWFGFGPAFSGKGVSNFVTDDVQTTHPKAGQRHKLSAPRASEAVKQIAAQLSDLPQQAEAEIKSLDDARRRIRELEREARARPAEKPPDPAAVQKIVDRSIRESEQKWEAVVAKLKKAVEAAMKFIVEINAKDFFAAGGNGVDKGRIQKSIEAAVDQATKLIEQNLSAKRRDFDQWKVQGTRILAAMQRLLDQKEVKVVVNVRHNEPFTVTPAAPRPPRPAREPAGDFDPAGPLPIGERKTLAALIQFPAGLERRQLTTLTGYKRTTRNAYIDRLRKRGFADDGGPGIIATAAGIAAMPDAQPLPMGVELQEYWLARLPEGESKILRALISAGGAAVERESLTEATGYKRTTRNAYLDRLGRKELVEVAGKGIVRASANLFDGMEAVL